MTSYGYSFLSGAGKTHRGSFRGLGKLTEAFQPPPDHKSGFHTNSGFRTQDLQFLI